MHAGPGASRTLGFLPTGRAWGAPLDAKMATLYYSMRLDDPRVAACWVPLRPVLYPKGRASRGAGYPLRVLAP